MRVSQVDVTCELYYWSAIVTKRTRNQCSTIEAFLPVGKLADYIHKVSIFLVAHGVRLESAASRGGCGRC